MLLLSLLLLLLLLLLLQQKSSERVRHYMSWGVCLFFSHSITYKSSRHTKLVTLLPQVPIAAIWSQMTITTQRSIAMNIQTQVVCSHYKKTCLSSFSFLSPLQ